MSGEVSSPCKTPSWTTGRAIETPVVRHKVRSVVRCWPWTQPIFNVDFSCCGLRICRYDLYAMDAPVGSPTSDRGVLAMDTASVPDND